MNKLGLYLLSITFLSLVHLPNSVEGKDKQSFIPLENKSETLDHQTNFILKAGKEKTSYLKFSSYGEPANLKFLSITGIISKSDSDYSKFDTTFMPNNDTRNGQQLSVTLSNQQSVDRQNHFWSDYSSRGITLINRNIVMLRQFKSTLKDINEHSTVTFNGLKISMKWE